MSVYEYTIIWKSKIPPLKRDGIPLALNIEESYPVKRLALTKNSALLNLPIHNEMHYIRKTHDYQT